MRQSDSLDKLAPAMAKAQADMGGAVKDSTNPFFKSKYADLTSVWQACKDALHTNGISVIQSPCDREGRIGVETMLLHSSGQFVSGEFTIGVKKADDPQADGSSITYARRYALAAFVGVCPTDDDGEGAMHRKTAPKPEPFKGHRGGQDRPPAGVKLSGEKRSATKAQMDHLRVMFRNAGIVNEDAAQFIQWVERSEPLTEASAREFIEEFEQFKDAFYKSRAEAKS